MSIIQRISPRLLLTIPKHSFTHTYLRAFPIPKLPVPTIVHTSFTNPTDNIQKSITVWHTNALEMQEVLRDSYHNAAELKTEFTYRQGVIDIRERIEIIQKITGYHKINLFYSLYGSANFEVEKQVDLRNEYSIDGMHMRGLNFPVSAAYAVEALAGVWGLNKKDKSIE